jgi:DNA gyrase/topoisomerase IV subunit A
MALQYAELGQRQAESEFDRVKFAKTYDLQTAIEERQRQESMTPTQQFQQKLALEEAKAKYKQDIEKTKSAEKMELENTRQKNREDIERLKAGLKTGKADTSSLDAKRKDLEKQLDNARRRATYLGDKSELEGDEAAGTRAAQWQKIADGLAADIAELDAAKAVAKQQPLTTGLVTGGVQSGGGSVKYPSGTVKYYNGIKYISDGMKFNKAE